MRDLDKLFFTETHEWVSCEDGDIQSEIMTIGLTQFAAENLKDVLFIEHPKIGTEAKKGASIIEIESVKAVADVYAPFDGEVCDINEKLMTDISLLSSDPYGNGWLFKIRPKENDCCQGLLSHNAYQDRIKK